MAQTIATVSPTEQTRLATGTYLDTGTVAAYTFTLGFKPRYVRVINEDGDAIMEWVEGMADAEGMKLVTGGTLAKVSSNGITPTEVGFTLGLDTDVNATSEQVSFIAMR